MFAICDGVGGWRWDVVEIVGRVVQMARVAII